MLRRDQVVVTESGTVRHRGASQEVVTIPTSNVRLSQSIVLLIASRNRASRLKILYPFVFLLLGSSDVRIRRLNDRSLRCSVYISWLRGDQPIWSEHLLLLLLVVDEELFHVDLLLGAKLASQVVRLVNLTVTRDVLDLGHVGIWRTLPFEVVPRNQAQNLLSSAIALKICTIVK